MLQGTQVAAQLQNLRLKLLGVPEQSDHAGHGTVERIHRARCIGRADRLLHRLADLTDSVIESAAPFPQCPRRAEQRRLGAIGSSLGEHLVDEQPDQGCAFLGRSTTEEFLQSGLFGLGHPAYRRGLNA